MGKAAKAGQGDNELERNVNKNRKIKGKSVCRYESPLE